MRLVQWLGAHPAFRKQLQRDSVLRRSLWSGLFFVCLVLLYSYSITPERYDVELNQPAPDNIYAPRTVIDRIGTEQLRAEAMKSIPPVFEQDPTVSQMVLNNVEKFFETINAERKRVGSVSTNDTAASKGSQAAKASEGKDGEQNKELMEAVNRVKNQEGMVDLEPAVLEKLLTLNDEQLKQVQAGVAEILKRVMQAGIRPEALDTFRRQIDSEAQTLQLNAELALIVSRISNAFLLPNMKYNVEETNRRREAAAAMVEAVRVLEGELIVSKGQRVNERQMALIRDLGLERSQSTWNVTLGSVLLALAFLGVVGLYLYEFERDVLRRENKLVLVGLITIVILLLSAIILPISGYLAPVAAGTMLISILVSPRLALILTFGLSLSVGIIGGYNFSYMFTAFVGGFVGAYSVTRVEQRHDLMRGGLLVSGANLLSILAFNLLLGSQGVVSLESFRELAWGAGNGIFSSVVTIGSLPFFESFFGIISAVKLIELSNSNQPLLKRLMMEAPGTYHHSIMVGNLVEVAAHEIGASGLLARTGAYYHDIGKLKRPYFFIENQFSGENPHDKITPSLSALILTSHIKDGIELARQAKLPEPIIEFIKTHHGDMLVTYFYCRAAENGAEHILEEHFRYDGPKPSSKETALVMLADSIEAAVRSLVNPSPGRIEGLVRKLIKDRLNDHQLDLSPLTFRDLDRIANAFVKVLTGILHPRIEYPEVSSSGAKQLGEAKTG